jgi:hypothetical protein
MKTLITLFTALTIAFTAVPASAQKTNSHPSITSIIQDNLTVPASMKGTVATERVRVVFTIDASGKAHVVDIASARPDIHDSVKEQFEAIDFSKASEKGTETYSIWLTFKVM